MISLGLALSLHLGLAGNYNFFHPYVEYVDDRFIAGTFYNSEDNWSFFVGKEFNRGDFGVEVGLVTGYESSPIVPMVRGKYKHLFVLFLAPR